jgi:glutamate-5-semialdehyde dehydrogenase
VTTADLHDLGRRASAVAPKLAALPDKVRVLALERAAAQLRDRAESVLAANERDLSKARAAELGETAIDRLRLDGARIELMAAGLETVAGLPDPVGLVVEQRSLANGLEVQRVQVPLGVVGVIYENRPNVTSDVAGLCLRSGNVAFLRGSSSALGSNMAVVHALRSGFEEAGAPGDAVILVEEGSHDAAIAFMQLDEVLDVLIPRGGARLIASMKEHATVPIILDGEGNCHVYVDAEADLDMAVKIVLNAKTQRPGVCNAMESLILHQAVARPMLERLGESMAQVQMLGDQRAQSMSSRVEPAVEDDFATEYLDLVTSVAVVDSVDEAIEHIARYGSGHSEAIITANREMAERFLARVDAAAVLWNASTRFVDGGELGLGAEVGISTQKLHARGPMGLAALMSVKWVIRGEGQVRW